VIVNPSSSLPCVFGKISAKDHVLKVQIGGKQFLSCPEVINGDCSESLDAEWWKQNGNLLQKGRGTVPQSILTFEPTKVVQDACGVVHVEGSFAIFKDIVAISAASAVSSGR
jgi:hypothetical protein